MESEHLEKPEVKILPLEKVYKHFRKIANDDVLKEEGTTNCSSAPPKTEKMNREQLQFTKNMIKEYSMAGFALNVIIERPKCVSRLWVPRSGVSSSTAEAKKFIGIGIGENPVAATLASSEDAYSRKSSRKAKKCSNSESGN